jgi:hypothetical protein
MEAAMKEEEFIKKLKEIELPEIELKSHRCALKMAIIGKSRLLNRKPQNFLTLTGKVVKGGIEIMQKGLNSRQPVWKILAGTALAIAALALSIGLPPLLGPSAEARAATIAKNSPEVQAALSDNETVSKVIKVIDSAGTERFVVMIQGDNETVPVMVDLSSQQVISIQSTNFTEAEKKETLDIAKADPRIQALLDKGGTINFEYGFSALDMNSMTFEQYGEISVVGEDFRCTAQVALNAKTVAKYILVDSNQLFDDNGNPIPSGPVTIIATGE